MKYRITKGNIINIKERYLESYSKYTILGIIETKNIPIQRVINLEMAYYKPSYIVVQDIFSPLGANK